MIFAWWWPYPAIALFAFASAGLAGIRGAAVGPAFLAGLFAGPIGVAVGGLSPVVAKDDAEMLEHRTLGNVMFIGVLVAIGALAFCSYLGTQEIGQAREAARQAEMNALIRQYR